MYQLKNLCTCTLLFLFIIKENGFAQLAIGQWREHLSYKKGISITQSSDKVFCATESGIFSLQKNDNAIERLSKITGLSDVNVNIICYNDYNNSLLIAYKNANIDLVKNKNIYNLPDIKRFTITANKTINNIYFRNELAYLACGFGIVVLDMNKKEIKDTYYIGKNGGYINIRDITSDANYLYAATDSGVYRASLTSTNLADFNSWNKLLGIPKGIYNSIAALNGKVYANYSNNLMTGSYQKDTVFSYDGTSWSRPPISSTVSYLPLKKMELFNNELVITFAYNVDFFDANGNWTGKKFNSYILPDKRPIEPRQAIIDNKNPKILWIADHINGIIKNYNLQDETTYFYPNGPNTSEVSAMSIIDKDLWVARGERDGVWNNSYKSAEAYCFSNETWVGFTRDNIPAMDTIRDIISVAINPARPANVYLGSIGAGLLEFNNGAFVKIWNETNSSLRPIIKGTYRSLRVFGCAFDKDNNLWVTNSYVTNPLSVKKNDGIWQSFNFSSLKLKPSVENIIIGPVIVNQYNQKWIILPNESGGIIVFDENKTWSTGDDKMKYLSSGKGTGNLPSARIFCLAEDHDGEIWIGTDKGIAVFYCADQIFSSSGCDAQQIFIEQDGHTQILLETENVTTIAVDGANRKWIGTENSGVYLMSADGTKQIQHFTAENSPILSNKISSIVINPKTGEVFFGTDNGIISYQSNATEGGDDFTDVYVFPNPVNPGYQGPIVITGLVENADVKITDISGTLVYQTKSLGGQAIWYGKNFKGENAKSGVYLVFCASEDGKKTYITKILKVN